MHESLVQSPKFCSQRPSDVVDALDDYILFTDTEGIVVGSNPKAHDYFEGKALGRPFWELYLLDVGNMDDALATFRPEATHTVACKHKHGTFSLRIVGLPRALAPYGGYVVIATDVHPIKEYQESSLAAWDDTLILLKSLFESAKDPILFVNENYEVVTANRRAETLFAEADATLANRDYRDLLLPNDRRSFESAFAALVPAKPWSRQVQVRDASGIRLPVEMILRRVDLSSFSLVQVVMRDLSTRMQLQEDLLQMESEVEDMSTTLKQVIRSVAEEKQELKEELAHHVLEQVMPAVERIAAAESSDVRQSYKSAIEDQITDFVDGTSDNLDSVILKLTPREIEICRLIQRGRKSREIAELLAVSFETLQTHRKNIRRKLGLKGRHCSLYAYLQQSDLSTKME